MKKKVIYTIIAAALLLLLYIVIFFLSDDNAEQSSTLSRKVTEIILNIASFFTSKQGGTVTTVTIGSSTEFEGIVRKLAHFSEYGCVGFLSYSIVVLWISHVKKGQVLILIQLFISAAFDEFHQFFIPGRYASWKDVLIDLAGGIMGMLLLFLLEIVKKRKKSREKHHNL